MTSIDYANIDNRYALPATQAAAMLGVKLSPEAARDPKWRAGAMYGALRWYAEVHELADGRLLVVSADDKGLSARLTDTLDATHLCMDYDDMKRLCASVKIWDDRGLAAARHDEAERAAFGL